MKRRKNKPASYFTHLSKKQREGKTIKDIKEMRNPKQSEEKKDV